MTIQDTAIEKLRRLPAPLAQLVNDFIDVLISQWAKLPQPSTETNFTPCPNPATEFTPLTQATQVAWHQAMAQIAAPDPNQHAAVTSLFAQWATENTENDIAEQQETFQWLTLALDDDRLSNRPLFP